jgi:tetratricopeptide (TPR) repeat protein
MYYHDDMKKSSLLFLVLLLFFHAVSLPLWGELLAEETLPSREAELLAEAMEAQVNERWELSIALLSRGIELYPLDYRFPWALGSLYYSRKLYGLAWDEYRKAEPLMPAEPEMLFRLSRTAGFLNMETLSAEYMEKVLELEPGNKEAIDNLAWMYYKLHRLSEGAELLRNAVREMGRERDFCNTLGTIYADMFRYDDSKNWYLEAIAAAEKAGDYRLAAVVHYNLSILESRYYHYSEAFDRTNFSLTTLSSSAGRLARGEIYLRRLDFSKTFQDYQAAYETDTSPLAKANLAQAYLTAGRLEESRLYAEDCLNTRDNSWMLNYGTDMDRYRRDLHELLYKSYGGLFRAERFKVYPSAAAGIRGFFQQYYYRFKEARHKLFYKKYSLAAARAYSAEQSGGDSVFYGAAGLDAQTEYYNAMQSYPRRAVVYLQKARELEIPLIPPSAPAYDAEEGKLMKTPALLRRAINGFDPVWERDMIAESLAELCLMLKGRRLQAERRDAAESLYALNKAALRQNGIRLPVEISVTAEDGRAAGRIKKTVLRMGFEEAQKGEGRFLLSITLARNGDARCELHDRSRGTALLRETLPLPSLSRRDLSNFATILENAAFTGF